MKPQTLAMTADQGDGYEHYRKQTKRDLVFDGLSYEDFVRPVLPRTIVLTAKIAVLMT